MSNTIATATPDGSSSGTTAPARTVIVCLPINTDPQFLPALGHARLATAGYTVLGTVLRFPAPGRRARKHLDVHHGFTCAGPIGLLDLDGMRRAAAAAAAQTWQHWNYIVAGTPIARPWWVFADRYIADPARYPIAQAQQDYLTQPRILAMRAFNALHHNALPTGELEALQQGLNTYATLGQLAAVAADGLATADGCILIPASTRLDDQLTYLHHANHHLAALPANQPITAYAVTTPAA
ncbi:hypothetical protein [Paractinoplanes rishiriensis]|uniref:Uncharacterized protein n=1 Tax=Paractinoplanes rishiriensis TaxID=1050105 RepID=A0A919MW11_9ACTN|nr:hypothetical protein [Actinoplanes rishiriensis]GIF01992.1 hypothetical protein Ari01nite_94560 [Actinoplanes rishiriensis]